MVLCVLLTKKNLFLPFLNRSNIKGLLLPGLRKKKTVAIASAVNYDHGLTMFNITVVYILYAHFKDNLILIWQYAFGAYFQWKWTKPMHVYFNYYEREPCNQIHIPSVLTYNTRYEYILKLYLYGRGSRSHPF